MQWETQQLTQIRAEISHRAAQFMVASQDAFSTDRPEVKEMGRIGTVDCRILAGNLHRSTFGTALPGAMVIAVALEESAARAPKPTVAQTRHVRLMTSVSVRAYRVALSIGCRAIRRSAMIYDTVGTGTAASFPSIGSSARQLVTSPAYSARCSAVDLPTRVSLGGSLRRGLIASVIAATIVPAAWVVLMLSNRDPFYLGACFTITLFVGPLSAVVLSLNLRSAQGTGVRFLWLLVAVNAVMALAVVTLLAIGWLRTL